MSNFLFLQTHFAEFGKAAREAETNALADPRAACFYARRALEIALDWMFDHDPALSRPYDSNLSAYLYQLRPYEPMQPVWNKAKLLKDLGNRAAHDKSPIFPAEALTATRELFHFGFWLARTYSPAPPHDSVAFDEGKLPPAPAAVVQKSREQLLRAREELEARDAHIRQQRDELLSAQGTGAALQLELDAARMEIAEAKAKAHNRVDIHDYNEKETRDFYIDLYLREAGWPLSEPRDTEWEVLGMPPDRSKNGRGFVDYVLWGRDGRPLAVVEAKRARVDPKDALQQAKLYADCLEKDFHRRPLIFTSNGYEHYLWDDAGNYPPRRVEGFYTRDELERLHQRRAAKLPLSTGSINQSIANRPYQQRAIRAFGADLEISRRRGLLVMATGTGKTRTAIAISELLSRAGWAKNILFLCDRRALVKQSFDAFKKEWSDCAPVNLLDNPEDTGRVMVSTYPTMMNLLEQFESGAEGTRRRFGPGYFDLVIIDEAHRGVYQKYRALFGYFDALFLGLTATPRSQVERDTFKLFERFDGTPTDSYELADAVAQEWLVPPRVITAPTFVLRHGLKYDDLSEAEREEWDNREWNAEGETPDEVDAAEINEWVFNRDTVSKVIAMLMERGQRVAGGDRLSKTIIFARNRKHANEIHRVFRENYPLFTNGSVRVITGADPFAQNLINDFSTPENPLDVAISVDMLDTGIDIPQIGNLVFFKPVRSRVKWEQMKGRGTRLCPDLFGPGRDKKEFFVFDFCGNYEYFNENPDVREAAPARTLSVRLFTHRVELLDGVRQTPHLEIGEELADGLHREVAAMNLSNVLVRPHRREVEKWREREAWNILIKEDKRELDEKLAALPTEIPLEDEGARQFDLLVYRLEIATLKREKRWAKLAKNCRAVAHLLLTTSARNVPMVAAHLALLEEMDSDEWWPDVTLPMLESMRKKLRELVRFIDKQERFFVFLDIEDDFEPGLEITYTGAAPTAPPPSYRKSVEGFLRANREVGVVGRLRRNEELSQSDLAELDAKLFEVGGFPDRATFEREIGPQSDLGEWVRRCVGLEPAALAVAFAKFLNDGTLSPAQIHFVEAIVASLAQNGLLDKKQLKDDPWKNIHAPGMLDLFGSARAREILGVIDAVNGNALAI